MSNLEDSISNRTVWQVYNATAAGISTSLLYTGAHQHQQINAQEQDQEDDE
jgi:hypothetical protein